MNTQSILNEKLNFLKALSEIRDNIPHHYTEEVMKIMGYDSNDNDKRAHITRVKGGISVDWKVFEALKKIAEENGIMKRYANKKIKEIEVYGKQKLNKKISAEIKLKCSF